MKLWGWTPWSSVQFGCSVISDSWWPHGLQHARHPCPSPTPRVYSNSCPLSHWCHRTISSSAIHFSSHLQSFPSGYFQMSQLFISGGQSIEVSTSKSVLPMNIQDWSPLGWTGWTSLQSKGLSRVFSNTTILKHQFFGAGLDEAQAGFKIAGGNSNNLRYVDDTILMEESEDEVKSLLMKVKEGSEKNWLKAQHSENKNHGIRSHHFMVNRWRNSSWLYFGGLQNHCRWWLQPLN